MNSIPIGQTQGDVPNSQCEATHKVVNLTEQLGALHVNDAFAHSSFERLHPQVTENYHCSPPLNAQDDLCPSFVTRKRFFSSIHSGLDKVAEEDYEHVSLFDGLSASMSTNFSIADASDIRSNNG